MIYEYKLFRYECVTDKPMEEAENDAISFLNVMSVEGWEYVEGLRGGAIPPKPVWDPLTQKTRFEGSYHLKVLFRRPKKS